MRLDRALAMLGLAPSRSKAQTLIRLGYVEVFLTGRWVKVVDPSMQVDDALKVTEVRLSENSELQYVSRGGLKLAGALDHFQLQVSGLRALDVGLSTGGFSDCLLQRGIQFILGVDVGHGQLAEKLKVDSRLVWIEGVNARGLATNPQVLQHRGPGFDLVVVDVSFISVTLIVPQLPMMLPSQGGSILILVKPQFEVGPHGLGKSGVVTNDEARASALARVQAHAADSGLVVLGSCESPILGGDGNLETFLLLKKA